MFHGSLVPISLHISTTSMHSHGENLQTHGHSVASGWSWLHLCNGFPHFTIYRSLESGTVESWKNQSLLKLWWRWPAMLHVQPRAFKAWCELGEGRDFLAALQSSFSFSGNKHKPLNSFLSTRLCRALILSPELLQLCFTHKLCRVTCVCVRPHEC